MRGPENLLSPRALMITERATDSQFTSLLADIGNRAALPLGGAALALTAIFFDRGFEPQVAFSIGITVTAALKHPVDTAITGACFIISNIRERAISGR